MAFVSKRVNSRNAWVDNKVPPTGVTFPKEDNIAALKIVTQAFLNSLIGLPCHDAEEAVKDTGFSPMLVEDDHMISSMLRPGVVVLWQSKDGCAVKVAPLGDPSQISEDQ
jgi:hypothetical protein